MMFSSAALCPQSPPPPLPRAQAPLPGDAAAFVVPLVVPAQGVGGGLTPPPPFKENSAQRWLPVCSGGAL